MADKVTHAIASKAFVFFIITLLCCNSVYAKCPTNGLRVNIKTDKNYGWKEIYAQIKDDTGIRKVEMTSKDGTNFTGVIPFSTKGFTFFIELSCNYFPKDLAIFADGDAIKKIRLKKKDLNYYKDTSDSTIEYIYEVNVGIETEGRGRGRP